MLIIPVSRQSGLDSQLSCSIRRTIPFSPYRRSHPVEEVLTRLAARLTRGYTDPALAKDDAAIDVFLADAAKETNAILEAR
jgi:hypothetical protein